MAEDFDEEFDDEVDYESGDYDEAGGAKRLLIMVLLPLLLVVGGAGAAYFSGFADPLLAILGGDEPATDEYMAGAGIESDFRGDQSIPGGRQEPGLAVFYDLPEMLVNLNSTGRRRNFLKMRVSLELADEDDILTVEMVLPRIVDNFQVYLRELTQEDLQGAAGIYRLREELLNRVNSAVRPIRVSDVLFKEMVVQ